MSSRVHIIQNHVLIECRFRSIPWSSWCVGEIVRQLADGEMKGAVICCDAVIVIIECGEYRGHINAELNTVCCVTTLLHICQISPDLKPPLPKES